MEPVLAGWRRTDAELALESALRQSGPDHPNVALLRYAAVTNELP